MPQMAPMWWSLMYLLSLTTVFLMVVMMFFNKNQKSNTMKSKINIKSINWKW
nr:ATP synthase F0 subunit 8 [Cysteochila lineata]